MPRVLLSVYDKVGLLPFASVLAGLGWDLVASGSTESVLRAGGLSVTSVERLVGMSGIWSDRVGLLHPAIVGGVMARDTSDDLDALRDAGFGPINMLVCNVFPFQEVVGEFGVSVQDAVDKVDVVSVALLRAAAKNFLSVVTVSESIDYAKISAELKASGQVELATRRKLAVKAFALTRDYDTAVHAFLSQDAVQSLSASTLPQHLSIGMQQIETLRYGENPHQTAAYYSRLSNTGPLGGTVLGGKQLSYNNILDLDAAWRAVSSFTDPTVVIVKHLNPTGIASGASITKAYPKALASDPVSAYGGVLAVNQMVDDEFIEALGTLFIEAIAAPGFTPSAQTMLANNRKNCRLLQLTQRFSGHDFEIRTVHNGLLVQSTDMGDPDGTSLNVATNRQPTPEELTALQFAWKVVQHVRSNAIVLAAQDTTIGIGGGLSSRVDAVQLAVAKAGENAKGAVMASDAYFPFTDGLDVAIKAGVTAVIQPGGSIRDKTVIEAANNANVAMVFTGTRHFRH